MFQYLSLTVPWSQTQTGQEDGRFSLAHLSTHVLVRPLSLTYPDWYQFILLGEQRHRWCVNNLTRVARGAERPGLNVRSFSCRSDALTTTLPRHIISSCFCILY